MRNRILTAIDFLKEGKFFRIDDLRLGVTESGDVEVAGWSQFLNIENLTKANSIKELKEIKTLFFEMLESSEELKEFMLEKTIDYRLYFDDYRKTSISICSEKKDILQWDYRYLDS